MQPRLPTSSILILYNFVLPSSVTKESQLRQLTRPRWGERIQKKWQSPPLLADHTASTRPQGASTALGAKLLVMPLTLSILACIKLMLLG